MDLQLFPISDYWWFYVAFLGFVGVMLLLDLGVFHKNAHTVSLKEASFWSVVWISLSLLLNFGFYRFALYKFQTDPYYLAVTGFDAQAEATRVAMEFLTGFVIEKALAVDNIFIFVMVFAAFGIPAIYQHRVLFFGILGALFFRGIFIALGAKLMAYHWVLVVFGVFLVFTGIKMLFIAPKPSDPAHSWQLRVIKKIFPITNQLHGQKFFIKQNGIVFGTPLLVALVFIEFTDIIFAIDSVPAIFAVTKEPMIVFVSNILAIMGLRSLYFMLAGVVERFIFLKYGLALVLIFVGLKMAWLNDAMGGKFPIDWSLMIIATFIFGSIVLSFVATNKQK